MGDQNWKVSATPRQRQGFLNAILLQPDTPKPKGGLAMRKRDRLRRALGINQILAARIACETQRIEGMPFIDESKLTDEASAFLVNIENAEELEAILEAVTPSEGDQVALRSILMGLLDRASCDPSVSDFDLSAPDDWTTPKNWRELAKAKIENKPLEPGQTRCPQCAHAFVPTEDGPALPAPPPAPAPTPEK